MLYFFAENIFMNIKEKIVKKSISSILTKYKFKLTIGSLIKLIEAIIEIFIPLIIAGIIDTIGNKSASEQNIIFQFIFMFVLLLAGYTTAIIAQYFAAVVSQNFSYDLRKEFFTHISTFSSKQVDNLGPALLSNRLINDINTLELGTAMIIRQLLRVPFICLRITYNDIFYK